MHWCKLSHIYDQGMVSKLFVKNVAKIVVVFCGGQGGRVKFMANQCISPMVQKKLFNLSNRI